jgi:hypothetical protein
MGFRVFLVIAQPSVRLGTAPEADAPWPMRKTTNNGDDRVKTGCAGVLLPLVVAAYGIRTILRQRTTGRWGREPTVGPEAVEFGIAVLGLAVLVHAWGFDAYKRHPVVRGALIMLGVAMFIKGIVRGW